MIIIDDGFPLGDGTADTEAEIICPYCGEVVVIGLDPGGGAVAEYIEDCEVCCRPWQLRVEYDDAGQATVSVRTLDD